MMFLGTRFYTDDPKVHAAYKRTLLVFDRQRELVDENHARVARGEVWLPVPDDANGTLFLDNALPGIRVAFEALRESMKAIGWSRAESYATNRLLTVVHQEGVLRAYADKDDMGEGFLLSAPVKWSLPVGGN